MVITELQFGLVQTNLDRFFAVQSHFSVLTLLGNWLWLQLHPKKEKKTGLNQTFKH